MGERDGRLPCDGRRRRCRGRRRADHSAGDQVPSPRRERRPDPKRNARSKVRVMPGYGDPDVGSFADSRAPSPFCQRISGPHRFPEAGRAIPPMPGREAYLPECGWTGLHDPTLGEPTSAKHVVAGVSNHPRGVMPISGTFFDKATSYLGMRVTVQTQRIEQRERRRGQIPSACRIRSRRHAGNSTPPSIRSSKLPGTPRISWPATAPLL